MLPNGLYEQVINKAIEEELAKGEKISKTEEIDAAESSKILSAYVADIVAQSLEYLKDSGFDTKQQVAFVNKIIESAISNSTGLTSEFSVSERAECKFRKNSMPIPEERHAVPLCAARSDAM